MENFAYSVSVLTRIERERDDGRLTEEQWQIGDSTGMKPAVRNRNGFGGRFVEFGQADQPSAEPIQPRIWTKDELPERQARRRNVL